MWRSYLAAEAEKLPLWGSLRSPELFCKALLKGEYIYISSFPLLLYLRGGIAPLLSSLFSPLLPRFITSVSPNLGWWGGCCMTRHMSGPLREKAGSLLLGLFSLRDHVPPSVTPGTPRRAPPLTLFMPSLAGMWLVYLLWPAARVKGTFWPHSRRGHFRVVQWLK